MNGYNQKIKILNIQLIGSSLFILSLMISIILTYNQKKYILNQQAFLTKKQIYIISTLNRLLILGIVLSFLYTSSEQRKIAVEKNSDVSLNNLDVLASSLTVISSIIILYVTIKAPVDDSLDIQNPNI